MASLSSCAGVAGLSVGEYVREILQHAVEQRALPVESLESQVQRAEDIGRLPHGSAKLSPVKRVVLFMGPVHTHASHQARMREIITSQAQSEPGTGEKKKIRVLHVPLGAGSPGQAKPVAADKRAREADEK